jgi:hypothetical protein
LLHKTIKEDVRYCRPTGSHLEHGYGLGGGTQWQFRAKLKSRRSGGWYLSRVTTVDLEIEVIMYLVFENTKSSDAIFIRNRVILLVKTKTAGGHVN